MIKIILCFPKTISTSQPGFRHADQHSEKEAMLSAWEQEHTMGSTSQLHTWREEHAPLLFAPLALCLLLLPCPHSNCLGHLEPPVEMFCSQRFPPSRLTTGHATFPAGTATSTQLPGSAQLPRVHRVGLETFSGVFTWCSSCLAYLASSPKIICPSAGI